MINAAILSKVQQIYNTVTSISTSSPIKSIQRGSGLAGTVQTITSVDMAKTVVVVNGTTGWTQAITGTESAGVVTLSANFPGGAAQLTSATQVTLYGTSGPTIHFTVVEYV